VKQKADQLLDTSNSYRMQNTAEIDDICIIVSSHFNVCPINFSLLFSLRSEKIFQLSGNTKIIGQYEICLSCISSTHLKYLEREICLRRKVKAARGKDY